MSSMNAPQKELPVKELCNAILSKLFYFLTLYFLTDKPEHNNSSTWIEIKTISENIGMWKLHICCKVIENIKYECNYLSYYTQQW